MKLGKRAIIIITSGVLLIGGVAACKHKMHSASAEERGEWVVDKVSKELELNDSQRIKLVEVKDQFIAVRKSMRSDREEARKEVLAMLKQPTMDREKVNAMVNQKIAIVSEKSPSIIDAIGNFYDSLDDSQRAELSEFIEEKMERHVKHHSH
jgi:Spy/CpxP family protein refolding chaperone